MKSYICLFKPDGKNSIPNKSYNNGSLVKGIITKNQLFILNSSQENYVSHLLYVTDKYTMYGITDGYFESFKYFAMIKSWLTITFLIQNFKLLRFK